MQEVIQSFVAVGGFGYLNYHIIVRVRDIDWGDSHDRKYLLFFLSSLNYSIYLLVQTVFQNMPISIVLTILLALVLSIFLPDMVVLFYKAINWVRRENRLPESNPQTMYDIFANDIGRKHCFVFEIGEKRVVSSGYTAHTAGEADDFSLILWPYILENDPELYVIHDEDALLGYLDKEKIQVKIYLNLDKRMKFIYF